MSKRGKGSEWERDVCTRLSLWWSAGADDSLFWRSSQSGGRATSRARRGKRTSAHHGDICAIHPSAEPLTDLLAVEAKRGYGAVSPLELLDKPRSLVRPDEFESWISQAIDAHKEAGTFAWLLITKRDKREPLAYVPRYFIQILEDRYRINWAVQFPRAYFAPRLPLDRYTDPFVGTTLDVFLKVLTPSRVRELVKVC